MVRAQEQKDAIRDRKLEVVHLLLLQLLLLLDLGGRTAPGPSLDFLILFNHLLIKATAIPFLTPLTMAATDALPRL